jgi:hypothetical protein
MQSRVTPRKRDTFPKEQFFEEERVRGDADAVGLRWEPSGLLRERLLGENLGSSSFDRSGALRVSEVV